MRKLPIKSTDRGVNSGTKENEGINIPHVNTKSRIILRIVFIALAIIAGTAICTSVIYFAFLKKGSEPIIDSNSEDNKLGTQGSVKSIHKKVSFTYKCSDIVANCNECKEVTTPSRNLAAGAGSTSNDDEGTLSSLVCTACDSGYYPILNEENTIIFCNKMCETGSLELCKTCHEENQNQCGTCNNGYYIPSDDFVKSKCKPCSDLNDKCQECQGTKNAVTCLSCKSGYIPLYNKKNEIIDCNLPCVSGDGELCKTCDMALNQCSACNNGYYLPSDDVSKLKCKKCSDIVTNCNECHGEVNKVTCDSFEGFENCVKKTCETGPKEKCLTCNVEDGTCTSCNLGYLLVDGKCILNYHYYGTYISTTPNEKVNLMYYFGGNIKKMIIDGEEIKNPTYYYVFPEPKIHEVYVLYRLPTMVDYNGVFSGCSKLLTIEFTPLFNISHVSTLNGFFANCHQLKSVDVSVFDTRNVDTVAKFFMYCYNLTSVDLSSWNFTKITDTSMMFNYCYKLTSVDFSKITIPRLNSANSMFAHCHSLISLDFSNIHTTNLRFMQQIFDNCRSLKYVNLQNFYTDNVVYMQNAFKNCSSLTSIDLSSFTTPKVTNMENMFLGCSSLTSINIGHFVTDARPGMDGLFKNCKNLKYINMTKSTYRYNYDIFAGVPNGGTIIVHPNLVATTERYLNKREWNILVTEE